MAYNSRMSQQYQSSNQKGSGRGSKQQQQKEQDEFILLSADEIAGCIDDIGVPFSPEDLWKPNPQQIQRVFELFAEFLMNATRETVEPAMRAAAEEVCGEYIECVPADTRNLMGFYVSLRKLLTECGIIDFSFNDLLKPTTERLVKIFSYIINFVRFRESHTATIDEHFNKAENTKARIETLYVENQDMETRLDEMKRERKTIVQQVKEKAKRNDELKQRLLELKKAQERIADHLERVRGEKGRLTGVLEERTANCSKVREDSDKLRPYILQSPAALQASLGDLSENLSRDRTQIDSLEKRTRALQTSSDAFSVVTNDVTSCSKILEEIAVEVHREDEENLKAARRKDMLSERSHNVREVEHTESILQKQLQRWLDRTETVRKGSREKAQSAKERMEELRAEHRKLTDERTERGREMERRRVRIEQTEKKMADLKENIENEIHSAHDEFMKIDSHIKLYITEMEQSIH